MKRGLYIVTCVVGLTISLLLLAICINSGKPGMSGISEFMGLTSKNILLNADFKEGLKNWNHDKDVSVFTTNDVNYACIEGDPKDQVRIWQNIPVTSGQTYRLTFNLTGPDKGAIGTLKVAKNSMSGAMAKTIISAIH